MKTLLTIISITILAINCCGQGKVGFHNLGVVGGDHLVYKDMIGGTGLVGTNFAAELYYGDFGTASSSLIPLSSSISPFRDPMTPVPGTWVGRTVVLPIGGVGVPITLDVRVWDMTQAPTYEDAVAAGGALGRFGHSGAFRYLQNLSAPPANSDTEMVEQPPFALIPEPATLGLGIIFAVGLVLFRPKRVCPQLHVIPRWCSSLPSPSCRSLRRLW